MGAWVPRECSRAFYNILEVVILGGLVWLAGCSIMRLVSRLSVRNNRSGKGQGLRRPTGKGPGALGQGQEPGTNV